MDFRCRIGLHRWETDASALHAERYVTENTAGRGVDAPLADRPAMRDIVGLVVRAFFATNPATRSTIGRTIASSARGVEARGGSTTFGKGVGVRRASRRVSGMGVNAQSAAQLAKKGMTGVPTIRPRGIQKTSGQHFHRSNVRDVRAALRQKMLSDLF